MEIICIAFIHSLIHSLGLVVGTVVGDEVRIYKAQVHAPGFQIGREDET